MLLPALHNGLPCRHCRSPPHALRSLEGLPHEGQQLRIAAGRIPGMACRPSCLALPARAAARLPFCTLFQAGCAPLFLALHSAVSRMGAGGGQGCAEGFADHHAQLPRQPRAAALEGCLGHVHIALVHAVAVVEARLNRHPTPFRPHIKLQPEAVALLQCVTSPRVAPRRSMQDTQCST